MKPNLHRYGHLHQRAKSSVMHRLTEAAVSKHFKRAKTLFAHAVKDRQIDENPFADVITGSEVNREPPILRALYFNKESDFKIKRLIFCLYFRGLK